MTKKTVLYVTLREIENAKPCCYEYMVFLKDIKSNLVTPEVICEYCRARGNEPKSWRKSQFGPDDPIPLETIMDTKSTSISRDGYGRVWWLIHFSGLTRLAPLRKACKKQPISSEQERNTLISSIVTGKTAKRKVAAK